MIIPHRRLSPDALRGVIEAFITREGTDYGLHEVPLADKARIRVLPYRTISSPQTAALPHAGDRQTP
jgi:uncharacterized protein YheU (UPF0270 family)